jgi:hypothetical protein
LDNKDDIVKAHSQNEHMDYEEILPEHIQRAKASQSVFDHAKKYLTKLYGGKRCSMCEWMGIKPTDIHADNQIESHHVFEWSHWNSVDIRKVEGALRFISPLIHGMYMMTLDDVLAGKELYSIWNEPEFKGKPFTSLDDARNQWFLCHAHHQQSNEAWQQLGIDHDVIGLHHAPITMVILYFAMLQGQYPMHHIKHHGDGLDRKV